MFLRSGWEQDPIWRELILTDDLSASGGAIFLFRGRPCDGSVTGITCILSSSHVDRTRIRELWKHDAALKLCARD